MKTKAKTKKFQRARLIELITREVKRLVRDGDNQGSLDEVMSTHMGWISNFKGRSDRDIGRAMLAVLPLAHDRDVELAAFSLIFGREQARGFTIRAADETVRRILEPLGVVYASCGCIAAIAGDMCCSNAVEARKVAA